MNNFYIYRWIRLDTNTPFYVGKGQKERAYHTKTSRNKYFRNILKTAKCEAEIMLYDLTEEQAFTKEVEFIKMYKSLGYCEANLTDGGEGASGFVHSEQAKKKMSHAQKGRTISEEHKQKISEALKGEKHPMFGKSFSEEHKYKLSKAKMGNKNHLGKTHSDETRKNLSEAQCKKVIDNSTGQIFGSIQVAAEHLKMKYSTLANMLNGQNLNKTSLKHL